MDWIVVLLAIWESVRDFYLDVVFPYNMSLPYSVKLLLALFFLIFIRAGLPRYRYDYITKLGWAKFLLLVTALLVITYFVGSLWS